MEETISLKSGGPEKRMRPDVYQTFLLDEIAGRLLDIQEKLDKAIMSQGVSGRYNQPYQHATLAAGANAVVWQMDIPRGHVGLLETIACDWYSDTYIEFMIDGTLVEKIEREIPINEPQQFAPPIRARHWIQLRAYNQDSTVHTIGVYAFVRIVKEGD